MKLETLGAKDVDRLRPLWLALHAHHQTVAPRLAPYVTDEVSWRERRRLYAGALADGGFGFIMSEENSDIGYLVCARQPMRWNATFAVAPMLWELVTVFIRPEWRGKGIGSQMLDAMDRQVADSDLHTKLIGAIPDNRSAVDLYKSRGFAPAWLTLMLFQRPRLASAANSGIEIETIKPVRVEGLMGLWLALHHHHQAVSPGLGPWVSDAQSWPIICALLEKSAQHGLVFAAMANGMPIAFASAEILATADVPTYADTWRTGDRIADIMFLVVDAEARGQGIGSALMDALDRELSRRGVDDCFVGAIAPNSDAIRFYERRGFRPAWIELIKR
ncbi:MAG: GNAT family N-acetyltransferase [Hyphomicrobiales bacterium]